MHIFRTIAANPAVPLSLGNVALAVGTAGVCGMVVTGATAAATIAAQAHDTWTGRRTGIPFGVLAAANLASAGAVIATNAAALSLSQVFALNAHSWSALGAAFAFASWGAGHAVRAVQDFRHRKPDSALTDPQLYYGAGDVSAAQGNPIAFTLFAFGLAKALGRPGPVNDNEKPVKAFARKHVTPARLYAAGYFFGAAMAVVSNPLFALAQTLWAIGYTGFEPALNRDLKKDFGRVQSVVLSKEPAANRPPAPF